MPNNKTKTKKGIYLPPAVGYSFKILFNLVWTNRVSIQYIPKLLAVLIINLINFPFRQYERLIINPKIKKKDIEHAPVFIVGHWRSGTTHLHNLLCQDQQMGYTTTYQSVFPDTLFNKLGLFLFRGITSILMPRIRAGDNVNLSTSFPQEEEFALGSKTQICFYYFWMFPRNLFRYYIDFIRLKKPNSNHLESWKENYKLLIKKALKNTNKNVYLSKNPSNTGRVKILLEMFPNAKFIHIHRNPVEVFVSTQKFFYSMLPHLQLQTFSTKEIDDAIFMLYKNLMDDYFEEKHLIPQENLFEFSFDQLQEKPLDTIKDLYLELNLAGFEEAQPKFTAYLKNIKHYKKNKHRIKKEHLDRLLVEWDSYMTLLNYSVPDNIEIYND